MEHRMSTGKAIGLMRAAIEISALERCILANVIMGVVLVAFAPAVGQNLTNGDATNDTVTLTRELQAIEKTTVATVFVVPPSLRFRIGLTEKDLKSIGCAVTTSEMRRIDELVKILRRDWFRIGFVAPIDQFGEPREGIYLTLSDASEATFLFEMMSRNATSTPGVFTHLPYIKGLHISGAPLIPTNVARWAANTGPPRPMERSFRQDCETFFEDIRG
jgi:hypothetical protein